MVGLLGPRGLMRSQPAKGGPAYGAARRTERTGRVAAGGVIPGPQRCSAAMRADVQDTVLARRAAKGDGAAFATLYDRHERRAYNLCYRITGSAEDAADATQETFLKVLERLPSLSDRELNFGSYLLTAARHASYDAIERRKRATPAAEIPDSAVPVAAGEAVDGPEPSALRAVHQEQIRVANEGLPPRQREALALRELEDLSYDQVADIMGMNRNSVAQLISRARINLRDGLRHGALVSIPAASADCETALPLLALAQDGELDDATSADWLARHLVGCATCRVRVEAMQEAGAAYRLWLPLVPVLWLRARGRQGGGADVGARPGASAGRASSPCSPAWALVLLVGGRAGGGRRRARADAPAHPGDDARTRCPRRSCRWSRSITSAGTRRSRSRSASTSRRRRSRSSSPRPRRRPCRWSRRGRCRRARRSRTCGVTSRSPPRPRRPTSRSIRCRRWSRTRRPSSSTRRRRRLRPASRRGSRAPTARSWAVAPPPVP